MDLGRCGIGETGRGPLGSVLGSHSWDRIPRRGRILGVRTGLVRVGRTWVGWISDREVPREDRGRSSSGSETLFLVSTVESHVPVPSW